MTQYSFGSGQLYATPQGGGAPLKFGTLQDVSVEFSGDMKELHGQYGFPVAVARGKMKVSIKAGNGEINIPLYNYLFFGEAATTTGSYSQAVNETATVPAVSPYTVTVANGAKFYLDLGVTTAAGVALTQVATSPAAGQYTVSSAGVYTFNAAQEGVKMLFNYIYTSTTGTTLTLTNQLIGTQPTFQLVLAETYENEWFIMQFNAVVCGKLSLPLKMDDFTIADLEFDAGVDATNTLGWMATST